MFTRIRSDRARRLFCNGKTIYMCACNPRPDMFATPVNVAMIEDEPYGGSTREELFERTLNACRYYNCINAETGKRVACYVKEDC